MRNGIINVAIRDVDKWGGAPWVWMIQLDDVNGDGELWECASVAECDGSCSVDCNSEDFREERSPWVPHTEMFAAYSEVGGIATTEHLRDMTTLSTTQRQDYTFFYNPNSVAGTSQADDLSVWVRESW